MTSLLLHLDNSSIWSSHSLIAARLFPLQDCSKVLDVGTASATLARIRRDKNLCLFGVIPNAGMEIMSIQTDPIPLELVSRFFVIDPGRLLQGMIAWFECCLLALLGYQFIVE